MNRKAQAKLNKKPEALKPHPFDDIEEWSKVDDFPLAPETPEFVKAFQKQIDDVFGAERGIVLAWSGDKRYWEEFYTDWFSPGSAKPDSLEKKPLVLWHEFAVNDFDYHYIYPPRWVLLERHDRQRYAPTWKDTCYVEDGTFLGKRKQLRPLTPPAEYYTLWAVIGTHEKPFVIGDEPPCCVAAASVNTPCFGKYRPPCDLDLIAVGNLRKFLDKEKAQRPDEAVNAHSLQRASAMTRHYIQQTQRQKAKVMRDFALMNPKIFLGENLEKRGITRSARELEEVINEAFDRSDEQKVREGQLS